MSRKQNQKGITLISLVITVIILLILAAVAINLAVDSNGLFRKAGDAANKWNSSVAEEGQTLKDMLAIADEIAPPEVWYKIDGTTVYFSSSQKDEGYKLAKSRYDVNSDVPEFPEWSRDDITIVTFEEEVTPISTAFWFYCPNLMQINNIEYLNTSKVTDMSYMFFCCRSLTSLDVSGLDTSNVTNMNEMFCGCESLTSLDISGIDTSNVIDMSRMFYDCKSLTSLDISGLDTSNVTDMSGMFGMCVSLTSLDINGIDTSNVTDMSNMFDACGVTSLDLSGFNTSNVTDMSWMFYGCKVTSLDLSGFNTSNVTDMSKMFVNCNSLTSLDMSKATFGSVNSYANMFPGMANGATIKVKDEAAKTFIQSRLNDAGVTATVEINTTT